MPAAQSALFCDSCAFLEVEESYTASEGPLVDLDPLCEVSPPAPRKAQLSWLRAVCRQLVVPQTEKQQQQTLQCQDPVCAVHMKVLPNSGLEKNRIKI
jgi:hypothetical protein